LVDISYSLHIFPIPDKPVTRLANVKIPVVSSLLNNNKKVYRPIAQYC